MQNFCFATNMEMLFLEKISKQNLKIRSKQCKLTHDRWILQAKMESRKFSQQFFGIIREKNWAVWWAWVMFTNSPLSQLHRQITKILSYSQNFRTTTKIFFQKFHKAHLLSKNHTKLRRNYRQKCTARWIFHCRSIQKNWHTRHIISANYWKNHDQSTDFKASNQLKWNVVSQKFVRYTQWRKCLL